MTGIFLNFCWRLTGLIVVVIIVMYDRCISYLFFSSDRCCWRRYYFDVWQVNLFQWLCFHQTQVQFTCLACCAIVWSACSTSWDFIQQVYMSNLLCSYFIQQVYLSNLLCSYFIQQVYLSNLLCSYFIQQVYMSNLLCSYLFNKYTCLTCSVVISFNRYTCLTCCVV